jgi:polar amino acid transport system permease protein
MAELTQQLLFVGTGTILTLQLLIGGLSIGLLLGTLLSVLRYNGIASMLITQLVSVFRGTPLLLQLSFIYYVAPTFLGVKLTVITAGIISFGLNSSAYIAEILRSGIENLPKGQFEAAKTLQIPSFYMWKDLILPQVIKNILPAMISEVIALLKETALIATIGGMDIMRRAQTLAAEQFTYFLPLCLAGCYYYGLVLLIESIGKKLEKRGSHANN